MVLKTMTETNIDIGNKATETLERVYGYYDPTHKTTETGVVFRTYFGLRQFYITGGFDNRLLLLEDAREIMECSREWHWGHHWDLHLRLMSSLIHNLRLNPTLLESIPVTSDVGWCKTGRLNKHEQSWLKIVRSVNASR